MGAFWIAISMYSKIPVPQVKWEDKNTRFVICFFPFVGVILCGLTLVLWLGMDACKMNLLTRTLFLVALPLFVTGGIHVDGFVDVSDALHSYGNREKKLEILKDPHIGAFAVIRLAYLGILFVGGTGLVAQGTEDTVWYFVGIPVVIWLYALGFVLARGFSGLAAVVFPNAKKEGTLFTFTKETDSKLFPVILGSWICITGFAMVWIGRGYGILILLGQLLSFWHYHWKSKKEFGGITGDLEGWFLVRSEVLSVLIIGVADCIVSRL